MSFNGGLAFPFAVGCMTAWMGPVGIAVAKPWPEPSICCYTGRYANNNTCCGAPLLPSWQLMYAIVNFCGLVLDCFVLGFISSFGDDAWEGLGGLLGFIIVTFLLNVSGTITCSIAYVKLKAAYALHGGPGTADPATVVTVGDVATTSPGAALPMAPAATDNNNSSDIYDRPSAYDEKQQAKTAELAVQFV